MSPSNINFVHNGYAPISVRLIELILEHNGMQPLVNKGFLKQLGLTEDKLLIPAGESKLFQSGTGAGGLNIPVRAPRKKKILVYFIGGITYAEMAAIRFL